MLELIVVDGRARGIVVRDMVTGEIETHLADAVVLASGGYGNVFFLSTNAKGCNVTASWRAHRKGALLREPLLHPDPPDVHPGERRPPVEAHADVGVAAQRRARLGAARRTATSAPPATSPRTSATTSWSAATRLSATWCRATSPRAPRRACATRAAASARAGWASTSTSPTRSSGSGATPSRPSTGTCSRCTSASPARTRTRSRCGSTPRCTTRWAACGSTTTCSRRSPACS